MDPIDYLSIYLAKEKEQKPMDLEQQEVKGSTKEEKIWPKCSEIFQYKLMPTVPCNVYDTHHCVPASSYLTESFLHEWTRANNIVKVFVNISLMSCVY